MDIRSPQPPDDNERHGAGDDGWHRPEADLSWDSEVDFTAAQARDADPVERVSLSVPTRITVAKFAVAAVIGLAAAFAPQRSQVAIGLVVAAAVAVYAVRDLFTRVRLSADASGIVVARGYAGHRALQWSEIQRLTIDTRTRLGTRAATLEIDTGGELYFFTRNDLGVEADEALATLEKIRPN